MALPNARNQYLKTQIETASKEQLVVMLFDGIIRFTEQARKAILEQQIEDSHNALMRAQAIIMELICTIDKEKGGEVANNMMSLHAYAFNCLIVCNMKKDVSKIDEVQKIYRELRDAWMGAMETLGISSNAGKPLNATPVAPATAATPATLAAPVPPAPVGAKPAPAPGIPGSGVMASATTPAAKPVPTLVAGSTQIAPPAQPAPGTPLIPKATGYGMGRTAMLGAANAATAPVAQPVGQPLPVATAATAVPQAAAVPAGNVTPVSAKHNAMMNAYSAGKRSIA